MRKIQQYLLPSLIAVSALSVSASAAFYSVSGLSKLFAGAALAVIIMATSLEVAKLVIASLLYQYRKTLPKFLKYYLSVACFVLILITSMGIYGFLSAAYQKTASVSGTIDAQITLVETKRDNIKEQLNVFNTEKESINKSVTDLRNGLSNNVITYTNSEGQVMTSTSSATRRALEKQLDQAIERQTSINTRVDDLNEKLFTYETEIVEVSTNNELTSELGPLKFLSELTGIPMNKIINVLLLIIIFVFDPLAIALVIAANFAFEQIKPKEEDDFSDLEGTVDDRLGEIEDWDEGLEEIIYGSDLEEEDDLFDTWYENMEFPLPNEPLMQAAEEYEATTSEEQIVEEEIPQLNMDIAEDYMHARPGYKPPNSIQADDGMGGKVY
tara:strand:- start:1581 stop:2732 length:1152 start_codon:yes stop_codon:yes gene_type:complete